MANIGVLIESGAGGIKETNFGFITAARPRRRHALAFLLMGMPPPQKMPFSLRRTKDHRCFRGAPDFGERPELQSAALQAALQHFEITALIGLSSPTGRDLLARVAAALDAPLVQDCLNIDLNAGTVVKSHFSGVPRPPCG